MTPRALMSRQAVIDDAFTPQGAGRDCNGNAESIAQRLLVP